MNAFQEDVNKVASWLSISSLERIFKLQIWFPCKMEQLWHVQMEAAGVAYIFNEMKIKMFLQYFKQHTKNGKQR